MVSPGLVRPVQGAFREIDRVLDVPVLQEVHQLHGRHDGAVFFGLFRGSPQMRNGDDLVRLDDLFIGEIRHVARHDAVGDGLLQGRGIHEPASGEIQDYHALLHDREFIGIDESLGVLVLRDMQRDEIALGQEFVQAWRLLGIAGQPPGRLDGQEWIVSPDFHAQALGGIGHHGADGAQTHHSELLAQDLGAAELGFALFDQIRHLVAFAHQPFGPGDSFNHFAGCQQHAQDDQFLHAVGVCARGIKNDDAFLRTFVDGNIVDTGAGASNCFQTRRQGHLFHFLASYQDAVRIGNISTILILLSKKAEPFFRNFI